MAFNSLDLFEMTVAPMGESGNATETAKSFLVARTIAAAVSGMEQCRRSHSEIRPYRVLPCARSIQTQDEGVAVSSNIRNQICCESEHPWLRDTNAVVRFPRMPAADPRGERGEGNPRPTRGPPSRPALEGLRFCLLISAH